MSPEAEHRHSTAVATSEGACSSPGVIGGIRRALLKNPRLEWLIPAALCLLFMAQLLPSVRQMSQHCDESTHLYAGYRILKCGDYAFGREHPPLAKMLAAIPLAIDNAPLDCSQGVVGVEEADQAVEWLYSQKNWWQLLSQARLAASLFSLALILGVWLTARRMFGRMVAVVSTVVLVFEPNLLGLGALVLNDVLLTALFVLTVFSFYLWIRRRSVPLLVATGVLTGLALLTKHSAVLLIAILLLLAVAAAWLETGDRRTGLRMAARNLGAVAAIMVIAAATIWCGFGWRFSEGLRRDTGPEIEQNAATDSADVRIVKAARAAHLLPKAYLDGLIEVKGLVGTGGGTFLLGRYYSEAPWYLIPLTAIVKSTLPLLAMLVLGMAGMIAMGSERRTEFVFLLLPPLLYLAAGMHVRRTSGVSHLLPMLPFLVIAASAGCVLLARRYRWAAAVLLCLLVLHALSSLHSYPNYLSYANEAWGGPGNLYKTLPATDVGQAYWQADRYMQQHPNTPCWLDTDFFMRPKLDYKIPCTPMGILWGNSLPERMQGIVFVSGSVLQLQGQPGGPLAPFYAAEPVARLGGSAMLVYQGEFDTRVAAARALDVQVTALLNEGRGQDALTRAVRAVGLAPSYPIAHELYGLSLSSNGRAQEGLSECLAARNLALAEGPLGEAEAQTNTELIKNIAERYQLPLPPGVQ